MRRPAGRAAAAVALLALAACWRGSGERFPGAPVVLVSIDTLRSDHLPAYGYGRVATPAIDALAKARAMLAELGR